MLASKRPRPPSAPPSASAPIEEESDPATPAILGALFERNSLAIAFLSGGSFAVALLPASSAEDLAFCIDTGLELPFPPTTIICNSQLPEAAKAALCGAAREGAPAGAPPPALSVLRAGAWALPAAQEALRRIHAPLLAVFAPGDALLLRCAGAVVAAARAAGGGSGGGLLSPPPRAVGRLPQPGSLAVDGATLLALAVFPPPGAPARGARGAPACLAHLLDTCASPSGSRVLRGWLRRPLRALAPLAARHDGVGFFAAAAAAAPEGCAALRRALRGAGDTAALRRALGGGFLTLPAWRRLRALCRAHAEASSLLRQLLDTVAVPACMEAAGGGGGGRGGGSAARPALLAAFLSPAGGGAGVASIARQLEAAVDWEASAAEGRPVPRNGLSASLDEHRALLAELPALLEALTEAEVGDFPGLRGALAYEVMPQLGALAAVRTGGSGGGEEEEEGGGGGGGGGGGARPATAGSAASRPTGASLPRLPPLPHGAHLAERAPPGWRLHFQTHDTLFFKTARADAHDAHYGDLPSVTRDLEALVMRSLEGVALAGAGALDAAGEGLAGVDALLALGSAAAGGGWVRPCMAAGDAPLLLATAARHPLQELLAAPFVANDVALEGAEGAPGAEGGGGGGGGEGGGGGGAPSLALLTGPNGGGKSVYLRSVALLALMAQAGSFVAAERALVGPVDRLLARLPAPHPPAASDSACGGGGEGGALAASSFGADALQVAGILAHATRHSLVVVDEWGKGTAALCGGALLGATVRALAALGARALVTTHFTEVVAGGLLADAPPGPPPRGVALMKAEVVLEGGEEGGEEGGGGGGGGATAVPLFRISEGVAGSAFGLHAARRAGVGERVLRRAAEVAACLAGEGGLRPAARGAAAKEGAAARAALLAALCARERWDGGGEGAEEAIRELLGLAAALSA
jgi:DNA mismatch repair ATPase MutS